MLPIREYLQTDTRRQFFGKAALGLGGAALATLTTPPVSGANESLQNTGESGNGMLKSPHSSPNAKRAIYLFMSGAPSQLDLFDYKP